MGWVLLLQVSQLARISRDHYSAIARANIYSSLRALLGHWDPGVSLVLREVIQV